MSISPSNPSFPAEIIILGAVFHVRFSGPLWPGFNIRDLIRNLHCLNWSLMMLWQDQVVSCSLLLLYNPFIMFLSLFIGLSVCITLKYLLSVAISFFWLLVLDFL